MEANFRNKNNDSPLQSISKNIDEINVYVRRKYGADVNIFDKDDCILLIYSVLKGHVKVVTELLKHGANVNFKDNDDWTPLFYAAQEGHVTVVTELLKHGADVNFKNNNESTPLKLAAENGHITVVTELLKHGADVSFKDNDDWTPLFSAAQEGHVTVVTELLKHGADVNFKIKNNSTPLFYAAQEGHVTVVTELLKHGANVNLKSKKGNTSLHLAAQEGHVTVVTELLKHGADVNCKNKYNWTPLHCVSMWGCLSIFTELLKYDPVISLKNKDFDTPLHIASYHGHVNIVTELLKHGSDINFKGKDDNTPLHCASSQGYDTIVTALLENRAYVDFLNKNNNTALLLASQEGHLCVVTELLKHGADVTCRNKNGDTALHVASRKCHVIIVEELLKHGAHLDFKINPFKGFLHLDADNLCDNKHHEILGSLKKKILQNYMLNILSEAEFSQNTLQNVFSFFNTLFPNAGFSSKSLHSEVESLDLEFLYKLLGFNFYGEFISSFQSIFKTENHFFISFEINLPGIGTITTDRLLTIANQFYDLANGFNQSFWADFKKIYKSAYTCKSDNLQNNFCKILGPNFTKNIQSIIELFMQNYKDSPYLSIFQLPFNEIFSEIQQKIQTFKIKNLLTKIGGFIAGIMFVYEYADYLELLKDKESSKILSVNNSYDLQKELLDLLIHNFTKLSQHPYVKVLKTYENYFCPDELKLQGSGGEGFLIYRKEKSDLDFIYSLKIFNSSLKFNKLIECPDAPGHVIVEVAPSLSECRNEQEITHLREKIELHNGKYYLNIKHIKQLIGEHIKNQLINCPPDYLVSIEAGNEKCFRIQFTYNVILLVINQITEQIYHLIEFTDNILPVNLRFQTYFNKISGNYYVSQIKWEYFQTLCSTLLASMTSYLQDIPSTSQTNDIQLKKFHIDSVIEENIQIIIEHFNSALQLLEYVDENFKFLVNILEELFYLQMFILISWGLYTIIPVITNKKLFSSQQRNLDDKIKFIFSEKVIFTEEEITQILDFDPFFICNKEITSRQKGIEINIIAAIINLRQNMEQLFYKKIKKSKSFDIHDININRFKYLMMEISTNNLSWHLSMLIHVTELLEIIKLCLQYNNINKRNTMEDQEHVFEVVPGLKFEGWPLIASAWISRERYWPEPVVIDRIFNNCYHVVFKSLKKDNRYDGRLSFSEAERILCHAMTKHQSSVYYYLKDKFKLMKSKHITSYHIKTICLWVFESMSLANDLEDIQIKYMEAIINKLFKAIQDHRLPHYFIPEHNLFIDLTDDDYEDIKDELKYLYKNKCFEHSDNTSGQSYSRGDTTNIEFLFQLIEKSFYQSVHRYLENFQI